jgi:hypothetical protein
MRWLWPILMFAITGWVAWYNDAHADRQVMFPFVDVLFPELRDDPHAMGRRSVEILFALAVGSTLFTLVEQVRASARRRRRRREEQGEE